MVGESSKEEAPPTGLSPEDQYMDAELAGSMDSILVKYCGLCKPAETEPTAITRKMLMQPENIKVQIGCMRDISVIARREVLVATKLCDIGAVNAVVSAMRKFAHIRDLQSWGCKALLSIAFHSKTLERRVAKEGGFEVVVDAMLMFAQDKKQLANSQALNVVVDDQLDTLFDRSNTAGTMTGASSIMPPGANLSGGGRDAELYRTISKAVEHRAVKDMAHPACRKPGAPTAGSESGSRARSRRTKGRRSGRSRVRSGRRSSASSSYDTKGDN